MAEPKKTDPPLVPPAVTRIAAITAAALMLASLVADALFGHPSHFGWDGFLGFNAIFGLVSGLVVIGVSKMIGAVLKRDDTYYDRDG